MDIGTATEQHQDAGRTTASGNGLSVRLATRADEPEILQLLQTMHAENGIHPLDETLARETFNLAFDQKGGILGVVGPTNDIRAMLGLLITRFWFTSDWHLEEIFNFVRPDQRQGTHYAEDLINFARLCSTTCDLPLVIGVLTNRRVEAKVRLYQRILGVPSGAFWVYNAPAWHDQANDDFWRLAFKRRRRGE